MKIKIASEILLIVIVTLFVLLFVQGTMGHFQINGSSMEPSLHDGEHILVNRAVYFHVNRGWATHLIPFLNWRGDSGYLFHPPNRGDVVILHPPDNSNINEDLIKRIIAIPGDTIEIKNGVVYVNGEELTESYIKEPIRNNMALQVVPDDRYFVMGDNRNNSNDSRYIGTIPSGDIAGKPWIIVWPLGKWGLVPNHSINVALTLMMISGVIVGLRRHSFKIGTKWFM